MYIVNTITILWRGNYLFIKVTWSPQRPVKCFFRKSGSQVTRSTGLMALLNPSLISLNAVAARYWWSQQWSLNNNRSLFSSWYANKKVWQWADPSVLIHKISSPIHSVNVKNYYWLVGSPTALAWCHAHKVFVLFWRHHWGCWLWNIRCKWINHE